MGWGMGWGWLFLLLVIVGVVLIVVAVLRSTGSGRSGAGGDVAARSRHAEEVLAERYARGEIDRAEYEERLRTLRGG
jgi:putative membrane protein